MFPEPLRMCSGRHGDAAAGLAREARAAAPYDAELSLEKDGREAVINVMERGGAVQVSYSLRTPCSGQ